MNTKMDDVDISKEEIMNINNKIEEHGFLQESIEILSIYAEGKSQFKTYGRLKLKSCWKSVRLYCLNSKFDCD